MNLEDLGWDAFFAEAFEPYAADNLIPARVSARHHGPCELFTERGRMGGLPAGKLSDEELPAVGRLGRGSSGRGRAEGDHRGRPAAAYLVHPQGGVAANRGAGRGGERRHGVRRHRVRLRPQPEAARAVPDVGLGQRVEPGSRRQQDRHRRRSLRRAVRGRAGDDGRAGSRRQRSHRRRPGELDPYIRPGRTIALLGSSGVGSRRS